jgi:hypothetical protein
MRSAKTKSGVNSPAAAHEAGGDGQRHHISGLGRQPHLFQVAPELATVPPVALDRFTQDGAGTTPWPGGQDAAFVAGAGRCPRPCRRPCRARRLVLDLAELRRLPVFGPARTGELSSSSYRSSTSRPGTLRSAEAAKTGAPAPCPPRNRSGPFGATRRRAVNSAPRIDVHRQRRAPGPGFPLR